MARACSARSTSRASCATRSPRTRTSTGTSTAQVVRVFTRMLDNVVEVNGLPLEQQRDEIMRKRRHGMGFLGLGSTITMLRHEVRLARRGRLHRARLEGTGARRLGGGASSSREEKGPAPIMTRGVRGHAGDAAQAPGDEARRQEGRAEAAGPRPARPLQPLHAARRRGRAGAGRRARREVGARFTHHSSIAPTGTISLSLANNASNGIEPSFAHHYFRNVIREGRKTKERIDVFSFELLAYRELVNRGAMPGGTTRGRQAAGLLHHRRRRHAARARGHPGGGAEVGRLLDLEDGQRARPTTTTTTSRTSTCTPTSRG